MFDTVAALQWNINRWYDAEVGRWISIDPISFFGGNMNLYGYVNNNSIFKSDKHGLLSSWAKDAIKGCWLPQFQNPPCQGIRDRIGYLIKTTEFISAANSLGIDLMLMGIPLPASLIGKVTVATLSEIVNGLLEMGINGNNPDTTAITEAIMNVLGATASDASILVPFVTELLKNTIGYAINQCEIVTTSYSTTVMPNNPSITENIDCVFTFCAKTNWYSFSVSEWTVSGVCSYTCADGPQGSGKKCCESGLSGFPAKTVESFHATGSSAFPTCNVTSPVP